MRTRLQRIYVPDILDILRRPALATEGGHDRSWLIARVGALETTVADLVERMKRLERERIVHGLMVTNAQQARNDAERLHAEAVLLARKAITILGDMGRSRASAEELLEGMRRSAKRARDLLPRERKS